LAFLPEIRVVKGHSAQKRAGRFQLRLPQVRPYLDVETALTLAEAFKQFSCTPILLAEFHFNDGIRRVAPMQANFKTQIFSGRVLSVSPIRRIMQRNLGIYEMANVEVELADVDRFYSSIAEPIKGKVVYIKLGTRNLALSKYLTIFKGKIDDYSLSSFSITFSLKDNLLELPEFPLTGFVDETNFPNALKEHRNFPLPVCYGTHSVTTSDDNRNRGAWPTLYVDNTTNAKKFLVAAHEVKAINEVYTNRPSVGSTLLTLTTDYTVQLAGTIAGKTMAWIQFTDAQFQSKVLDPPSSGTSVGQVVCNVQGKHRSGTVITNPIDVLRDFLENYCGDPSVDDTSFNRVFTTCSERSYVVRGGYADKKPTQNVLSEFCRSFNLALYLTRDGLIGANLSDPADFAGPLGVFDEGRDIFRGSWSLDREAQIEGAEDAQLVNRIQYAHDLHYANGRFFANKETSDTSSIASYGEKRLVIEMPWTGDDATATDVVGRILFLFKNPVAHATFKTGLQGLLVDIGDEIAVTHANGPGVAWSEQTMQLLSTSFNPQDYSTQIRARDVAAITEGAYYLDDESARVRVSNGTAAVANGSADINFTGATSMIAAGVQVGDVIRLKTVANEANRLDLKITEIVDADTVRTAQTVWTNESGIGYEIVPSWLTASDDQKTYGHLCDETTGKFSNNDDGFVLL
jgi:hypothetical protein